MENKTPEELFSENHKLIWYVIRKYTGTLPFDEEDFYQELAIILWRCCLKFDTSKGYKFSTYATKSMKLGAISVVRDNLFVKQPGHDRAERTIAQFPTEIDWKLLVAKESEPLEDSDELTNLRKKLSKIKGRDGVIIRDYILKGSRIVDIAKNHGISKQGIEQILNRTFLKVFGMRRKELLQRSL